MTHKKLSFVEQCLAGDMIPTAIDEFVDRWHAGEGEGTLAEFLGFTSEEYAAWVEDSAKLERILDDRRRPKTSGVGQP